MNSPPFLISFTSDKEFLDSLPSRSKAIYGDEFSRLCGLGLPPAVSTRCLALLFGYSTRFVGSMYRKPEGYYRIFHIPKGKGTRIITAPKVALKVIQKWFGHHLAEVVKFDPSVFGFVKERSTFDAAARHCGADWVYSVDIENFFPSISLTQVTNALKALGYSEHGAELMAKLCCFRGGLAQGSPASPVLSNLIFRDADKELARIASSHDAIYSRYADDIVLSSTGTFPEEIRAEVKALIASCGWTLSKDKESLSCRPNRLKVHGLLVHGSAPRLTKGYRNKIRAYKHLAERGTICSDDLQKINGHLSYAKSIENKLNS